MGGETIIAAVLSFAAGGGGARLLRTFGPSRDRDTVQYYREVAEGLEKENGRLWERIRSQEGRIGDLEATVAKIAAGELPAEYT